MSRNQTQQSSLNARFDVALSPIGLHITAVPFPAQRSFYSLRIPVMRAVHPHRELAFAPYEITERHSLDSGARAVVFARCFSGHVSPAFVALAVRLAMS